jgi:hypothetical protein
MFLLGPADIVRRLSVPARRTGSIKYLWGVLAYVTPEWHSRI